MENEVISSTENLSDTTTSTPVEASVENIAPVEVAPSEKTEPSLLGADKAPELTEPQKDSSQETVEVKEEPSQSDEPAPLPSYEAFTLPEGVTANPERLTTFTNSLGELENAIKSNPTAAHDLMQSFGQRFVDMHIAEMKSLSERLTQANTEAQDRQGNEWKDSFLKDPDIGGNRQETTLKSALEFIQTHGGNEAQQQEFRELMDKTGVGNHPAMIRMLANAGRNYSEGKPLPATQPMPQSRSKIQTRYGQTG